MRGGEPPPTTEKQGVVSECVSRGGKKECESKKRIKQREERESGRRRARRRRRQLGDGDGDRGGRLLQLRLRLRWRLPLLLLLLRSPACLEEDRARGCPLRLFLIGQHAHATEQAVDRRAAAVCNEGGSGRRLGAPPLPPLPPPLRLLRLLWLLLLFGPTSSTTKKRHLDAVPGARGRVLVK
jgi:hypothetical protein